MTVSVLALRAKKMNKTLSLPERSSLTVGSAVAPREEASKISQWIGPQRKAAALHFQRGDGSSFVPHSKVPQILNWPMEDWGS